MPRATDRSIGAIIEGRIVALICAAIELGRMLEAGSSADAQRKVVADARAALSAELRLPRQ